MAVENNSTVRWFSHQMAGAPPLTGEPGSLLAILDACLINGFGTASPDGNKIIVSGGVATVEFSGGNDFEKHAIVEIAGATPAGLNDLWRVTGATANTFTFECPGIPDGNATGSITVKRATPGGWGKPFTGTNLAAYQSTGLSASGVFFRFDDSSGKEARVRGYESMQDIDTGINPFPTIAQKSNAVMWPKSNAADSSARSWWIVADEKTVYLFSSVSTSYSTDPEMWMIGDFATGGQIDPANAMVHGSSGSSALSYPGHGGLHSTNSSGRFTPRNVSQQYVSDSPFFSLKSNNSFGNGNKGVYPQPFNNGLLLDYPVFIRDNTDTASDLRGWLPGLFSPMHTCAPISTQIIENIEPDALTLMFMSCETPWTKYSVAVDIKGPWQ